MDILLYYLAGNLIICAEAIVKLPDWNYEVKHIWYGHDESPDCSQNLSNVFLEIRRIDPSSLTSMIGLKRLMNKKAIGFSDMIKWS